MPHWVKSRLVVAVALLLGVLALFSVPGLKLLAVFFLLPFTAIFGCLALFSCAAGAVALWQKAWRVALAEGLVAAIIVMTFIHPQLSLSSLRIVSDYLQLALSYPALKAKLDAWPDEQSPKVLVVETDGFLSGASGLAFDSSGEIAREPGTQSLRWKSRVSNSPLELKCWYARHLIGSFYSWSGEYACD